MVRCCHSDLGRGIYRFMIWCIFVSSLPFTGCATRVPPSPRGSDASILVGRDAVALDERIEVFTDAGEHFAATIVSSKDENFKVSHKNPLDAVSKAHQDHDRVVYSFDETQVLRTATKELESGDDNTMLVVAVVAACVAVSILGLYNQSNYPSPYLYIDFF